MRSFFIIFFVLTACMAGHVVMTEELFYDVEVGMSEKELRKKAGKPYEKKKLKDGTIEYAYIERVEAGGREIETRKYIFIIKDGRVIRKDIKELDKYKPILERNAYDLQTSKR